MDSPSPPPLRREAARAEVSTARGHVPAVEVFNPDGAAQVIVTCDHATNHVPPDLGDLGLDEASLQLHVAWDIGAADVTRRLAELLDAPAVFSGVSRLVIDCNRRPGVPTSIPEVSDGVPVPGNRGLTKAECRRRVERYFLPYHRTIARMIGRFRRRRIVPALVAVHSFTPMLNVEGVERPWHVGIVWHRDGRLPIPVMEALRAEPEVCVGDNEPYTGQFEVGYGVKFHAMRVGLPHVMFEVRQDLIDSPDGALQWGDILARALADPLGERSLYRTVRY